MSRRQLERLNMLKMKLIGWFAFLLLWSLFYLFSLYFLLHSNETELSEGVKISVALLLAGVYWLWGIFFANQIKSIKRKK